MVILLVFLCLVIRLNTGCPNTFAIVSMIYRLGGIEKRQALKSKKVLKQKSNLILNPKVVLIRKGRRAKDRMIITNSKIFELLGLVRDINISSCG